MLNRLRRDLELTMYVCCLLIASVEKMLLLLLLMTDVRLLCVRRITVRGVPLWIIIGLSDFRVYEVLMR